MQIQLGEIQPGGVERFAQCGYRCRKVVLGRHPESDDEPTTTSAGLAVSAGWIGVVPRQPDRADRPRCAVGDQLLLSSEEVAVRFDGLRSCDLSNDV